MSDVNWGLLQTPQALDPVTAQHYIDAGIAARQQAALNQQKQDFTQQQALAAQQQYHQAGKQYAAGDYRGAQATLLGTGNADVINAGTSSGKESFSQDQNGLQAIGGFLNYVKSLPPEQRAAVIQHNAPLLEAAGAHPDHIAEVAANPSDDMINAAIGLTIPAEKQVQQGIDQQNANTNQLNATTGVTNSQTSRMTEQRLANTPVGISTEDNVYLPGQGTGAAGVGGATGANPGAAPASGAYGTDRAARNNNPGNLKWDGKSKWQGMTGVDPQGFVQFDSPANGTRALAINLANQATLHGINTVQSLITKYAPQGDGNNTAAYIQTVANSLGVSPTQQINLKDPAVLQKVMPAIIGAEGHGTPSLGNAPAQGAATGAPAGLGAPGGPVLLSQGVKKPSPNDIDPDDPAVTMGAKTLVTTGQLPQLGNGSGPLKRAIYGQVAKWGVSPQEIAQNASRYKALTQAAALTEKQLSTIGASEGTAKANAEIFLQTSRLVPGQSAVQPWNALRQEVGRKFGDSRVTDMDAAAKTFLTEFAKVVSSSPNGAGQLSDSARHEAEDTLRGDYSLQQKQSALKVLYADMENRTKYIQAQRQRQQDEIGQLGAKYDNYGRNGAGTAPASQQTTPPTKVIGGKPYWNIGGRWFDNAQGK